MKVLQRTDDYGFHRGAPIKIKQYFSLTPSAQVLAEIIQMVSEATEASQVGSAFPS
jgi:hypothetical protein